MAIPADCLWLLRVLFLYQASWAMFWFNGEEGYNRGLMSAVGFFFFFFFHTHTHINTYHPQESTQTYTRPMFVRGRGVFNGDEFHVVRQRGTELALL